MFKSAKIPMFLCRVKVSLPCVRLFNLFKVEVLPSTRTFFGSKFLAASYTLSAKTDQVLVVLSSKDWPSNNLTLKLPNVFLALTKKF